MIWSVDKCKDCERRDRCHAVGCKYEDKFFSQQKIKEA